MTAPVPVILAASGGQRGGTERIVDVLARGLDGARFRVWMALAPSPEIDGWADDLRREGHPVDRLPEITNRLQIGRAMRWFRFLRRHRDALLHVHHTYPAADRYLVPLAHLAGVRAVVVTEHLGGQAHSAGQRLLKRWERSRSDVTVAVSADVARSLTEAFEIAPELIEVVMNGVEAPPVPAPPDARARLRAAWDVPADARVWLCVARLEAQKGLDLLVEAWALLPAPRPYLVVVGGGSLAADLERWVAERGLGASVRLVGPARDARELYAAADGFALCSRWEGMPLTLLEAMAAGLPCVVTDVGGVAEVSDRGRAALVVPAENPRAFADSVLEIERDPQAARALGERGARRVLERYSERRMVDAYEAVYERALRIAHQAGAAGAHSAAA